MVAASLGVTFLGYGILYYGLCMILGKTVGFSTVLVPGKYKGTSTGGTKATKAGGTQAKTAPALGTLTHGQGIL